MLGRAAFPCRHASFPALGAAVPVHAWGRGRGKPAAVPDSESAQGPRAAGPPRRPVGTLWGTSYGGRGEGPRPAARPRPGVIMHVSVCMCILVCRCLHVRTSPWGTSGVRDHGRQPGHGRGCACELGRQTMCPPQALRRCASARRTVLFVVHQSANPRSGNSRLVHQSANHRSGNTQPEALHQHRKAAPTRKIPARL